MKNEKMAEMTLAYNFSDSIVQFSFGIADCGKIRGGGSGRNDLFRLISPLLLCVVAVVQQVGSLS